MKKTISAALAATLLPLALLAGCSGGSDSGSGSNSSAAAAGDSTTAEAPPAVENAQGVTDTQILIANSAATSGTYAPVGVPFLAGLQAYLDMVNAAGGVDGREIKFLHTDDEFDPAKGSAALTEFVEDEKVFAIVGHFGTPVVAATVEQLKEYGIPAVYFATGIGQLYAEGATTNEEGYNIFPVQPIYRTEGSIMVAFATAKFEAKKIGIIYTNDDAGMDIEKGAVAQIEKLDGITYVEQQVAAGSADVSAAVTSIKNENVDFIIVASIQGTFPTIVKELAAQGVNKDCISTYVNTSDAMSKAVVDDIQGKFDVYSMGWVDYASDIAQQALADYQAHVASEYAMNAYAQTGWIAGTFFVEGLKRLEGQPVTWESYMKALESAPIQNPFGGQIDYANGNRLGTQEMNLSKVVPVSDDYPSGWEQVEPLESVKSLLGQ
ncbi:MAG: ABC transporter substrate-binding protein [Propionibacteriaceae bacterium]|jgi:ABC-type branched-subunit amino acid transport system substrate-binding protein|nr:ABC transporter substrate-binding protein [Propionibacteriaceae bacterium]